jgi:hypothetical protein
MVKNILASVQKSWNECSLLHAHVHHYQWNIDKSNQVVYEANVYTGLPHVIASLGAIVKRPLGFSEIRSTAVVTGEHAGAMTPATARVRILKTGSGYFPIDYTLRKSPTITC